MEVFDVAANIEDKLIERVRSLAPDKQRAVLDFVEDLAEPESKNLWDKIREIMESVPPEAWEGTPTDGSINVDHYLYGAAKREE